MTIITQKATVAQIPFGQNLTIEGLLLENGSFAIAQQQVAALFSVIPTSAPKWLKSLLPKDFELFQVKTDRHKDSKQNRSELAVSLEGFERVIIELTIKQNPIAIQFTRALVGLSLTQLFSDAFNIKFEKKERQEHLAARFETKEMFWVITTAIKQSFEKKGEAVGEWDYSNAMNAINRGLFGKSAKEIRAELGLGKKSPNRDHFNVKALKRIATVQESAAARVERGENAVEAIKAVIEALAYDTIEYRK